MIRCSLMTSNVWTSRIIAGPDMHACHHFLLPKAWFHSRHLVLAAAGDDARPVRTPLDVHQRLGVQVEREQRGVLAADLSAVPDPQAAVGGACASHCHGLRLGAAAEHTFVPDLLCSGLDKRCISRPLCAASTCRNRARTSQQCEILDTEFMFDCDIPTQYITHLSRQ